MLNPGTPLESGRRLGRLAPWIGALQWRIRKTITPLDDVVKEVPEGASVLEIGCGEGLVLERLIGRSPALTGVDLDHRKLAIARDRLGADSSVRLVEAEGEAFLDQAPAGSVQVLLLVDTLSSFPEDRQAPLLSRCARVLAPGGTLLLKVVDGQAGWKTTFSRILSGLVYRVLRLSLSHGQTFHYAGALQLETLLRAEGLEVARIDLHRLHFHPVPHVLLLGLKPVGPR